MLKIAKQKEGRLGKWPLAFDGAHQSFVSLASEAYMNKLKNDANRQKAKRREQSRNAQVQGQVQFREIPDPGNLPL